ncbi:MAG: lipase [Pseudomonadota bacterium]
MGDQLIEKGVDARVIAHSGWKEATNEIIRNRKKYGKRPVVLIGHSLGANAIIRMATHLKKARIRVDYMASFAATDPDPVPTNVRKFTNYYFKTDGWGDEISAAKGFRGQLKNIDFSKDKQVGHFNIDKQPRLQRQVINNVMRFVRKKKATSRAAAKQTSDNG